MVLGACLRPCVRREGRGCGPGVLAGLAHEGETSPGETVQLHAGFWGGEVQPVWERCS